LWRAGLGDLIWQLVIRNIQMTSSLIDAMLQPDFYPHPVRQIQMLQTHISWVFLTGKYAYKLKKPLDLGFLDFTSLEKRRIFCEQELHLNRRLAPAIYLEVLPISRTGSTYQLGNANHIEDYCLKMLQFSQDDLLDRKLDSGNFNPVWMDALAKDIARFHATAATSRAIQKFGDPHFLREHIMANLAVAEMHIGTRIDNRQLAVIKQFCENFLHKHANDIAARQQGGYIRDCHGDLHLKNMALFQGQPMVFDCIEFNDEFRMIDTMNDVAFLVMDCDARTRSDLGLRFLSRYLEFSGDYAGLALLPLYLSYRSGVRGKVACLLSDDHGIDAGEKHLQQIEAERYFNLAASYASSAQPRLFAIGGLSGSGKSHLALLACGIERAIVIRSDATRKRIAKDHGRIDLYGPEMNIRTYEAMFKAAKTTLAAGLSVILDATFLRLEDRKRIRQLAESENIASRTIWLDVDESSLRKHIKRRMRTGKDASDADLHVLDMQLAHYQRPQEADIRFLSSAEKWPAE